VCCEFLYDAPQIPILLQSFRLHAKHDLNYELYRPPFRTVMRVNILSERELGVLYYHFRFVFDPPGPVSESYKSEVRAQIDIVAKKRYVNCTCTTSDSEQTRNLNIHLQVIPRGRG
jgi:hypothetical protein